MKKYITLLATMLITTHMYADGYVFGGRAHFQGVLINSSCSVLVENPTLVSIGTPDLPIQIHFSLCPVGIYNNLAIGLSEQNKSTEEVFYTNPQTQQENDFEHHQDLNVRNIEPISRHSKLIRHIDLPDQYYDFSKKSIGVSLNQIQGNSPVHASNILISVFYP